MRASAHLQQREKLLERLQRASVVALRVLELHDQHHGLEAPLAVVGKELLVLLDHLLELGDRLVFVVVA